MSDEPKPPPAPAPKPLPPVLSVKPSAAGAALDAARERIGRLCR